MTKRTWCVKAHLLYADEIVDVIKFKKDGPFSGLIMKWFPLSMLNHILVRVTHVPTSRSRVATVVGVKDRSVLVRRGSDTGPLLATISAMKEELAREQ